jgi:hypothetical protein
VVNRGNPAPDTSFCCTVATHSIIVSSTIALLFPNTCRVLVSFCR